MNLREKKKDAGQKNKRISICRKEGRRTEGKNIEENKKDQESKRDDERKRDEKMKKKRRLKKNIMNLRIEGQKSKEKKKQTWVQKRKVEDQGTGILLDRRW
jgi:hypothetical protein